MLITNCGLGHGRELRRVGIRGLGLCLLLIAALAGGCAHLHKRQGGAVTEIPAPQPPAFLNGPMALLLTNVAGFRAHAELVGGPSAKGVELVAGELMGRGGMLVFAPGPGKSAGKRSPTGGFAFIWDVPDNRGCLLNDPLQAFAPIPANLQFTNLTLSPAGNSAASERVAGHPCQPSEATVAASDGSATVCRLWRAADLKGLPLRITCVSNGRLMTLTLSKARLETMPDELFLPPNGFVKYDTADALMNELAARQQSLKRRPASLTQEAEPGSGHDIRAPSRPE